MYFPSVTRTFLRRLVVIKSFLSSPGLSMPEIQGKVFSFLLFWPPIPNPALLRTAWLLSWSDSPQGTDKGLFPLSQQGTESSSRVFWPERTALVFVSIHNTAINP